MQLRKWCWNKKIQSFTWHHQASVALNQQGNLVQG